MFTSSGGCHNRSNHIRAHHKGFIKLGLLCNTISSHRRPEWGRHASSFCADRTETQRRYWLGEREGEEGDEKSRWHVSRTFVKVRNCGKDGKGKVWWIQEANLDTHIHILCHCSFPWRYKCFTYERQSVPLLWKIMWPRLVSVAYT